MEMNKPRGIHSQLNSQCAHDDDTHPNVLSWYLLFFSCHQIAISNIENACCVNIKYVYYMNNSLLHAYFSLHIFFFKELLEIHFSGFHSISRLKSTSRYKFVIRLSYFWTFFVLFCFVLSAYISKVSIDFISIWPNKLEDERQ